MLLATTFSSTEVGSVTTYSRYLFPLQSDGQCYTNKSGGLSDIQISDRLFLRRLVVSPYEEDRPNEEATGL